MKSSSVPRLDDSPKVQLDAKLFVECSQTGISSVKNVAKTNGKSSSRSSRHSKISSNGSGLRPNGSRKRERSESSESSESERDGERSSSFASSSSSDSDAVDARKSRKRRRSAHPRSCSSPDDSSAVSSSSQDEDISRKHRSKGSQDRKIIDRNLKMEKKMKTRDKRGRRRSREKARDPEFLSTKSRNKDRDRHKRKERHSKRHTSQDSKGGGKRRLKEKSEEVMATPDENSLKPTLRTQLQVTMDAQEQQKALIRRNAELAKARLASGELQRARDEQAEMHRLYGAVDWRAKKKLRSEKRRLERTIAAGNKLATIEEREVARMDAFRVALGLPTAEAQRQAEWRAEATRALAEQEAISKDAPPTSFSTRPSKHSIIGPRLPPC